MENKVENCGSNSMWDDSALCTWVLVREARGEVGALGSRNTTRQKEKGSDWRCLEWRRIGKPREERVLKRSKCGQQSLRLQSGGGCNDQYFGQSGPLGYLRGQLQWSPRGTSQWGRGRGGNERPKVTAMILENSQEQGSNLLGGQGRRKVVGFLVCFFFPPSFIGI